MTTHLALLTTYLPALVSTGDEDPLFNDDWAAAVPLYPQQQQQPQQPAISSSSSFSSSSSNSSKPPITLLLTSHGPTTILFDPSASEIAVADTVLAITITSTSSSSLSDLSAPQGRGGAEEETAIQLLSLRTLDAPSRLTASDPKTFLENGDSNTNNTGDGNTTLDTSQEIGVGNNDGMWRSSKGGVSRKVLKRMVDMCTRRGGVGEEVLKGLALSVGTDMTST